MNPSSLPYFLGCPSWSENAWRDYLYPADANTNEMLGYYSQVFNAVEGNTTFYARPAPATPLGLALFLLRREAGLGGLWT
ncbi:DUF72 domain-containing protein, partial [Mycobacterium tuberculosis]|nr:DUF72 domain-containing protein [Mycobacterium tuberculosis]